MCITRYVTSINLILKAGTFSIRNEVVKVKDPGVKGITSQLSEASKPIEVQRSIKHEVVKIKSSDIPQKKTSSSSGNLEDLERLAQLRDKGILTEEEFQAKKKQILGL